MWFGAWNARSMYREGSLMTMGEEISKYKLDLVRVLEVRWDEGGTEAAGKCTFFCGRGMRIVNKIEVSLYIRESYQPLRG
jgi:hypothetical protein